MKFRKWLVCFLESTRRIHGSSFASLRRCVTFSLETLPERDSPSVIDPRELTGSSFTTPETSNDHDYSIVNRIHFEENASSYPTEIIVNYSVPLFDSRPSVGNRISQQNFDFQNYGSFKGVPSNSLELEVIYPTFGPTAFLKFHSEAINETLPSRSVNVIPPASTDSNVPLTIETKPNVGPNSSAENRNTSFLIYSSKQLFKGNQSTKLVVQVAPEISLSPITVIVAPPVLIEPSNPSTQPIDSPSPPIVPLVPNERPPFNVEVTPFSLTNHPTIQPSTPVFQISAIASTHESNEIAFTLSAHDSIGSVSLQESVRVSHSKPVIITPGSLISSRSPELMTITLLEKSFGIPKKISATQFLMPIPQIGDSTLFEAHRLSRSNDAFGELVRRHEGMVLKTSEKIVGNRADAQDVGQFVFLELSRFPTKFSGAMVAWLRTVSRNTSLEFLRAKRRRHRYELATSRSIAIDATSFAGLDDDVEAALQQLPTEVVQAVKLRYLDGYSQREAAQIVGCPRGTLSRRAASGIQTLRTLLLRND